jgi:hypothetical protein
MKNLKNELPKTASVLTENDVLLLATPVPGMKLTYLSYNLRYIRNYPLQKAVQANEAILKEEAKAIVAALETTYGAEWNCNQEAKQQLDTPSKIELQKVAITENEMVSYNPNYDALTCLEFIRK